jgi:site-specific recombinase XerD
MNIKYILSATKNSWRISVRMYYGKFDLSLALPIFIENSSDWDSDAQQLANSSILNEKLLELKTSILKQYNLDFTQGVIISKKWIQNVVSDVFNRPSGEKNLINNDAEIYFTDFGYWWIKNHSANWKVSAKKFISKVQISQYKKFLDQVVEFEKSIGSKLVLKDLSQDNVYEFANYLEENGYNSSTIERAIGRMKFILNRSFEHDIKTSKVRNQRIYIEKEDDEIESVYLNEKEIQAIYDLNLDHDYELENIRDNFVLSLWFGLRITDFMTNLKTENIKDGFVSIKTQKTGSFVKLPIHPMAKSILDKRFGNLPRKVDVSEYNIKIKVICQLANIDNQVYGKLWNPKTKRKELVYAPKYKFVSSHIARKSLATNLSGKVSDEVIMSAIGWSNVSMKQHYDKTSKTEYAETLKNYWNGN